MAFLPGKSVWVSLAFVIGSPHFTLVVPRTAAIGHTTQSAGSERGSPPSWAREIVKAEAKASQ